MTTKKPPKRIDCNACKLKPTCTELCKAAERYVSQDTVEPMQEVALDDLPYGERSRL